MSERAPVNLSPEERAEVMRIQDRLIELLVNREEAVSAGDRAQADALGGEIKGLFDERDRIEMWACTES